MKSTVHSPNLISRQIFVNSILGLGIVLLYISCRPGDKKSVAPVGLPGEDLSGLVYTSIPGSDVQYARQLDANTGHLQIEGFMKDGRKTGMWTQYSPEGDIELINHYVDGQLEGIALRMSFRNQVDLRTTYRKGKLDGPYTTYKFGKVVEERMYKEGLLDGPYKIYDDRTFKLKQEMAYKADKLDGYFRYFNEEGAVTLEYVYKDGEKISGGMTEPAK